MEQRERAQIQTVINNLTSMNQELSAFSRLTTIASLKVKIHGVVERIKLNIEMLSDLLTSRQG